MRKRQSKQKTVMVFGTFDLIHPGHENLFLQAKQLFDEVILVVSVARDKNVLKIKGRLPDNSEKVRQNQLKNLDIIDKVILGALRDYIKPIVKIAPDVIALGYDQIAYTENLEKDLKLHGLKTRIIRLKSYKPSKYKTSLLKQKKLSK